MDRREMMQLLKCLKRSYKRDDTKRLLVSAVRGLTHDLISRQRPCCGMFLSPLMDGSIEEGGEQISTHKGIAMESECRDPAALSL